MSKKIRLGGRHAVGDHQFAIVDDDMFDELNRHAWKAKPNGSENNVYAVRNVIEGGKWRTVRMHRVVLGYDGPLDVDHINRNSLDNRIRNLRVTTRSENILNARIVRYSVECRQCRTQFSGERQALGRPPVYCSVICSTQFNQVMKEARRLERRESLRLSCHHCGEEFLPARSSQRFCGQSCKKAAKWIRQRLADALPPSSKSNAEYSRCRRAAIKDGTWRFKAGQ